MKKIFLTICALLSMSIISLRAQSIFDLYNYSDNNYASTARTLAMGNAFTALGGDLGSIGINPAGGSVNSFSQITFSPMLNFNKFNSFYSNGRDLAANGTRGRSFGYDLGNWGINFVQNFYDPSAIIKSINFGIVASNSDNSQMRIQAGGVNRETSYMTYLGSVGDDWQDRVQKQPSYLAKNPYSDPNVDWISKLAYDGHLIKTYDTGEGKQSFIGATDKITRDRSIALASAVEQSYYSLRSQSKHDYTFNMSMNCADKFFIGANLTFVSANTQYAQTTSEKALNPNNTAWSLENPTLFESGGLSTNLNARTTAIYAKFGFIAVPFPYLRIGASVQTPQAMYVNERSVLSANSKFSNSDFDRNESTPEQTFEYSTSLPAKFSLGMALVSKNLGILSADYEVYNAGKMRFDEKLDGDPIFNAQNRDISYFFGYVQNFRLGLESRLTDMLSLRLGYSIKTNPELTYSNGNETISLSDFNSQDFDQEQFMNDVDSGKLVANNVNEFRQDFSLGLGINSNGPFYCDLAMNYTKLPQQYTSLYDYANSHNYAMPYVLTNANPLQFIATIGYRF